MIGSHNSFTFKNSPNWLFNKFNYFWRCQNKTMREQYDAGVRFFDIRVYRKDDAHWGLAHGLVNLYGGFDTISTLLIYMITQFPEAYFRVLLEKGDDSIVKVFTGEVSDALASLSTPFTNRSKLYQAIIKSGWNIIYSNPNEEFIIHDYCYTPILTGKSFWYNVKHFKFSSIKKYAKKHNPKITQEMIDDPKEIHFMDFVI